MYKPVSLFCAVAMLSGCASMVNGQQQAISIETSPVKGAECKLKNDKGEWDLSSTPGKVTVGRAYGDLSVKCKKEEYAGEATVKSKTKPMAFGNILAGGVIGAAVDAKTGAAYDYPESIKVEMAKK